MAKVRIINSYSLECLKNSILSEIEEADNQIIVCEDELEGENAHRRNEKTVGQISGSRHKWLLRRDVLHQCLCKIENHTKVIEI